MLSNPHAFVVAACLACAAAAVWWMLAEERRYWSRQPSLRRAGPKRAPSPAKRAAQAVPTQPSVPVPPPRRVPWAADVPRGTSATGAEGEARVAAILDGMGFRALSGPHITTDGGYAQLDHVVRVGDHVVVIETKNWNGNLEGRGRGRNWNVMRGGRVVAEPYNPVLQVERHVAHVRALVGGSVKVKVKHLVVMAGEAAPPDGAPDCVLRIADLPARLAAIRAEPGDAVASNLAWADVHLDVERTPQGQAREAHLMDVERRFGRKGRTLMPYVPKPAKGPRLPPRVPIGR